MQQRQRIQRELQSMQQECVKEYLEGKLQQITTKEVIHDILQQFLQANNQQFLQNISENIIEAKQQNRALKKQLEILKEQGEQNVRAACQAINQECQRMLLQEVDRVRQQQGRKAEEQKQRYASLEEESASLKRWSEQLQENARKSQVEATEAAQLRHQLTENKRSFNNFKDSCEKIINESNREKEREKQRIIDQYKKVEERLEQQLKEQVAKASQEQKIIYLEQIDRKNEEIRQLQSALDENRYKLQEIGELYTEITYQLEESRKKERNASTQLSELKRTFESMELSLNYLKEENSYLREEILSFSGRYQKIQGQKTILTKEITECRSTISKLKEKLATAIQHQQDYAQIVANYKSNFDETVLNMQAEVAHLKSQIENYSLKLAEKDKIAIHYEQSNQQLHESYLNLKEQLGFKDASIEVLKGQLQQLQSQVVKSKQQGRVELEQLKQRYENNWNLKNEQLIQEKYRSSQLQEEIARLNFNINFLREEIESQKKELQARDEREKYYQLLSQELSVFRRKLAEQGLGTHNNIKDKFKGKEKKIYFLLSQMQREIEHLKASNEQLRMQSLKSISGISNYLQETIAYMIARSQPTIKVVEFPKTPKQEIQKKHIQLKLVINSNSNEALMGKTVQQRGGESNNFTQIKKTLKNIQQRYQTVQSQNKFYSSHLDQIMKKT